MGLMNSITIHCERLPDGRLQIFIDEIGQTVKRDLIVPAFNKAAELLKYGIPSPDEFWTPEQAATPTIFPQHAGS